MNISQKGIDLIKGFEDCILTAYNCPAGIPTIGYGHTGCDVYIGRKITKIDAERILQNDLKIHCNNVRKLVKVPLNQNQFDALVSLEFNIGYGNFASSTLLKLLNTHMITKEQPKDFYLKIQMRKLMKRSTKGCFVFDSSNKVLSGLVRRRKTEQELFF